MHFTGFKDTHRPITIYRRILLVFFVVLIPFFLMSITVGHVAEKRLLEQYEERMENQVRTSVSAFDTMQRKLYSTMKVNLIKEYRLLLANDHISLSAYMLGRQVEELFLDLQQMKQISEDIEDIAVFMPRTTRVVSLNRYYKKGMSDEEKRRIDVYMGSTQIIERLQDAFRLHVTFNQNIGSEQMPLYIIEVTFSDHLLGDHLNAETMDRYAILSEEETAVALAEDLPILESARPHLHGVTDDSGKFRESDYLFCYQRFLGSPYYLVCYTPFSTMLSPVHSFRSSSVIALILALASSCLVCLYLSHEINRPFQQLITLFHQVKEGKLEIDHSNIVTSQNEFSLVFQQFEQMMTQIRELMDQRVKQEAALQQAQYRELQAHIAPHFLYNSFNVLRHCILMQDQETAEHLTRLLAKFFKYLTYEHQQESVSLAEEYEHCTDYLAIQKIRFGDSLTLHIEGLPEEYGSLRVPPFTLQPLAENIFKHGTHSNPRCSEILIDLQRLDYILIIRIRDNGKGISPDALERLRESLEMPQPGSEHYGLYNLNQRLHLFRGGIGYLTLDSVENQFFEVQIHLSLGGTES